MCGAASRCAARMLLYGFRSRSSSGDIPPNGMPRLFHGRHDELRALAGCGRPARGNGLQPRVEAHAVGAVHVQRAEQRPLPAAERMKRHWHGDWHVDAHHACLHTLRKPARGFAACGEYRRAVPVLVLVDERERGCQVRHPHDAEHRPEYLLLIYTHRGLDPVEETRPKEVTFLVPGDTKPAPVHDQPRALLHAKIDI